MGYKSVITTWKKIQDWVLELLEGLGLGTAYKYDKASDTATVKAGTIKNESGSFAWINSLGQWIINLGTNAAETWGILGNYRFGQDSNGNGTWNSIFQKDTQGNNLEVLHSDMNITQLMHKGEENFAASDSNANIKKTSNTGTGEMAFAVFSNYEVHIGSGPSPDNQKSGLEIRQYYRNAGGDGMGLKFRGRYIMDVNQYGSVFLAAIYKNMEYPCIRSGRDTLDKGFYTELLMANRAYQQIGVWETGGMSPTPPTPYTPSAGEYDYRFEYDALGRLIYECKDGYQKFYHPDNGVVYLDVYKGTSSANYKIVFRDTMLINCNNFLNNARKIHLLHNSDIYQGEIAIGCDNSNATGPEQRIIIGNNHNSTIVTIVGGDIVSISTNSFNVSANNQSDIKADYKQVTTSGSVKKAFKTYYYEYSGTYAAANPQFALYKSQMGSPFTTLDIAGRCRHMHATIKFTNSSNNLNIFNLCDKCYICNSSGDVWVNLNDVTYQMTDGTAYTIFFQFEIEES